MYLKTQSNDIIKAMLYNMTITKIMCDKAICVIKLLANDKYFCKTVENKY